MPKHRRLLLLALPLVLAGCVTGGSRLHTVDLPSFYSTALTDRDGRLEVIGNPFSASDAEVADKLSRLANRKLARYRPNFTTNPGDTERKPYKLVFAFNPPVTLLTDDICANPSSAAGGQSSETMDITAVFCGGDALVESSFRLPATRDLNAKDVDTALTQIFIGLDRDSKAPRRANE